MLNFKQYLNEGPEDPAIFKAVFLAGGAGSGKSFIVGKTGLTSMGYKVVNSDNAFEWFLKKANIEMTPDNIFSPKGQEIRGRAKKVTQNKQLRYMNGRLGLVLDGTGRDIAKIKGVAKNLQLSGYDTAMIFVNTDLDTALKRNRERARTLPDKAVSDMWKTIQSNIGEFQRFFGKENMLIVDNSEGKDYVKETLRAYKDIRKFTNAPIANPKHKKYLDRMIMRKKRDTDKGRNKNKS